jgi:hypothetical protein
MLTKTSESRAGLEAGEQQFVPGDTDQAAYRDGERVLIQNGYPEQRQRKKNELERNTDELRSGMRDARCSACE